MNEAARRERALRERLAVPDDAAQVLVLGETSHWDPNWLFTSEEYYERRIRKILDEVIVELRREPRRIFSLENIFFLRMYWEREPSRRAAIRSLVEQGRIRFSGTGVTTPDTVLPDAEAIIRDYLIGQEWLRSHALPAEPRLAYLPDNFGHSPALPSILVALGFDKVAITRIDGMYFVATDYRRRSAWPLAGSSAALLTDEHRTLDFVWRGPDGAEVLCHWNAFTYFQGDMLAHLGIIRWMGVTFGVPWRTGRHIARRIRRFVAQLGPLARTPYLFCPIGCDFNGPIPGLVDLLDRYNREHYVPGGLFVVNASLEDYLVMVDAHRERLPVLTLDPNPYWMGFYASRPAVKIRCNRVARKLILAEKLTALPGGMDATRRHEIGPDTETALELEGAWDLLAVSNHHDFITGTAPDRVWRLEQEPWLADAEALADSVLARAVASMPQPPARPLVAPPRWHLEAGVLRVSTPHYEVELRAAQGGCITHLAQHQHPDRGQRPGPNRLAGPSNDLVVFRDTGGLWRMGHEFRGGSFTEVERASATPASVRPRERDDGVLEVEVECRLAGRVVVRRLWFDPRSPVIRMQVTGAAAPRNTVTCRFETTLRAERLSMDVPGGVVLRPRVKLYDPTFWATRGLAHVEDEPSGAGLSVFMAGPGCVSLGPKGTVDWVLLRNAPKERAFGLLPLLAFPARGTDPGEHAVDYAVWFSAPGDLPAHRPPFRVQHQLEASWLTERTLPLEVLADGLILTDDPDVRVTAIKRADRGLGLIVRLHCDAPPQTVAPRTVTLSCLTMSVRRAHRCDGRERDLDELVVDCGRVNVPVRRAITSVRLLT